MVTKDGATKVDGQPAYKRILVRNEKFGNSGSRKLK